MRQHSTCLIREKCALEYYNNFIVPFVALTPTNKGVFVTTLKRPQKKMYDHSLLVAKIFLNSGIVERG